MATAAGSLFGEDEKRTKDSSAKKLAVLTSGGDSAGSECGLNPLASNHRTDFDTRNATLTVNAAVSRVVRMGITRCVTLANTFLVRTLSCSQYWKLKTHLDHVSLSLS